VRRSLLVVQQFTTISTGPETIFSGVSFKLGQRRNLRAQCWEGHRAGKTTTCIHEPGSKVEKGSV